MWNLCIKDCSLARVQPTAVVTWLRSVLSWQSPQVLSYTVVYCTRDRRKDTGMQKSGSGWWTSRTALEHQSYSWERGGWVGREEEGGGGGGGGGFMARDQCPIPATCHSQWAIHLLVSTLTNLAFGSVFAFGNVFVFGSVFVPHCDAICISFCNEPVLVPPVTTSLTFSLAKEGPVGQKLHRRFAWFIVKRYSWPSHSNW